MILILFLIDWDIGRDISEFEVKWILSNQPLFIGCSESVTVAFHKTGISRTRFYKFFSVSLCEIPLLIEILLNILIQLG